MDLLWGFQGYDAPALRSHPHLYCRFLFSSRKRIDCAPVDIAECDELHGVSFSGKSGMDGNKRRDSQSALYGVNRTASWRASLYVYASL